MILRQQMKTDLGGLVGGVCTGEEATLEVSIELAKEVIPFLESLHIVLIEF